MKIELRAEHMQKKHRDYNEPFVNIIIIIYGSSKFSIIYDKWLFQV